MALHFAAIFMCSTAVGAFAFDWTQSGLLLGRSATASLGVPTWRSHTFTSAPKKSQVCHLLPQEGPAECARSDADPREDRPSTPLQYLQEVVCCGTLDSSATCAHQSC